MAVMWNELLLNKEKYLISAAFEDEFWKISLTNLVELFSERTSREEIYRKCQMLNPLLSVDDVDINGLVDEMLNNIPKYIVEGSLIDKIHLQTVIDGGFFKYEVNLSKATDREFSTVVTLPLCQSVCQLKHVNSILIDEIRKKEEEIAEYKASGAELLRKNIETKPFNDDILRQNILKYDENQFLQIFQSIANVRRLETTDVSKNDRNSSTTSKEVEENVSVVAGPVLGKKSSENERVILSNSEVSMQKKVKVEKPSKPTSNNRKTLKRSLPDFLL